MEQLAPGLVRVPLCTQPTRDVLDTAALAGSTRPHNGHPPCGDVACAVSTVIVYTTNANVAKEATVGSDGSSPSSKPVGGEGGAEVEDVAGAPAIHDNKVSSSSTHATAAAAMLASCWVAAHDHR